MKHLKTFEQNRLGEKGYKAKSGERGSTEGGKYGYGVDIHGNDIKEPDYVTRAKLKEMDKKTESLNDQIEWFEYINLEKDNNGIWIYLNDKGKEEQKDIKLTEQNFYDYFDDVQGNSEYYYFDDIGDAGFGLTNAPGITDGYYYNDDGELTDEGHDDAEVYWFPNYMVEDFTETLIKQGKVFFEKG